MATMLALLITIVAGVALAHILHRPSANERPRVRKRASNFRAVSIVPADGKSCCPACDALAHRRSLIAEAPVLPRPECTAVACSCRYHHHADRRDRRPGRRLREAGHVQSVYSEPDRRRRRFVGHQPAPRNADRV
jgi:hypothetical protein